MTIRDPSNTSESNISIHTESHYSSSSCDADLRVSSVQTQAGTSNSKMEDDIFADAEEDVFADASGLLDKPKPTKVKFELQDSEETTITNPSSTKSNNGNSVKDAMSAWMASFTTPMARGATGGTAIAAPSLPPAATMSAATAANVSNTSTVAVNRKSVAPFTTPPIAAIERRISPAGELWTNSVNETLKFIENLKKEQKLPSMTRLPDGFKVPRGITMRPSRKWQAQMYYNGKSHYIGVFENQEVAALAYEMMRQRLKKNIVPDSPYYDIVRKALNGPETINDTSSKGSPKESAISSSATVKPAFSSARKDQVNAAKSVASPKTKQPVAGKVKQQSESIKTTLAARPPPPPPPPPPPQPSASSSTTTTTTTRTSSNPVVTPTPLDEKSTRKPSKKKNIPESTKQKKAIPAGKKPSKTFAKHTTRLLRDSDSHFVLHSSSASLKPPAKKMSTNTGQEKLYPLSQSTSTRDESPFTNILKTREVPVSYRKISSGEIVNGGHWTDDEQERFLEGLRLHGRGRWKRISKVVGTRTTVQVKTHAQTYFEQGGVIPSDRPWAEDEKQRFNDGLKIHGYGQWKMIAIVVKTRSPYQVESYARAFYTQQNKLPSFPSGPPKKHGRERKPSRKVRETSHLFVDDYNHNYADGTSDAVDTDTMSIDEYDSSDSYNHYEDDDYNDRFHPTNNVDDRIAPSEYPWMSTTIVDDTSPETINGDEYMTASASNDSQSAEQRNNGSVGPRLGDFSSIFGSFSGRGPFG